MSKADFCQVEEHHIVDLFLFPFLVIVFNRYPCSIAARCRTVLAEYNMSCDDVSQHGDFFYLFFYYFTKFKVLFYF